MKSPTRYTSWAALLVCLALAPAYAQLITTFSVAPWLFKGTGKPAVNAPLGFIRSAILDAAGNAYVVDSSNCIVVKIAPSGILTVVAGNGICDFSGDGGPASSASLNNPTAIALDGNGNLYIADYYNNRVRKVSAAGIITTFAGIDYGFAGDGGPAVNASFMNPGAVAADSSGNVYIWDNGNYRVRKVNSTGIISTYAGTGARSYTGDNGLASKATFAGVEAMVVDSTGNLYLADAGNNVVRRINAATGIINTVAGGGGANPNNVLATSAGIGDPSGLAVDAAGNLYITDSYYSLVLKVNFVNLITIVAGNGNRDFTGDGGSPTAAALAFPSGVAVDPNGNLYIADGGNGRVRLISGGTISTIGGNGAYRFSGDGGPASGATLNGPQGMARDTQGNLYIADFNNNRVRKIAPDGTMSTFAGNGFLRYTGDGGPATAASLNGPRSVATDANGNVFIVDSNNHAIRKVNAAGTISTVAGGRSGSSGDGGQATAAAFYYPQAVVVDTAGNLFIADSGNNRVRKVSFLSIVSNYAGNGTQGFSGDNGVATSAMLNSPQGLVLDAAGNLYIVDSGNNRIRKVTSSGTISTFAGNGTNGFSGDGGQAASATLNFGYPPYASLTFDAAGNLYFTDGGNGRVRRVTPNGIISTVAGGGQLGDGSPATQASLQMPAGVVVDPAGNIFISDGSANNVREVLAAATTFALSPATLTFTVSAGIPGNVTQQIKVSGPVAGLPWSANTTTQTGGGWLALTPAAGALPDVIGVFVSAAGLQPGTYQGSVIVTVPGTNPGTQSVAVTLKVNPALPATLQVQPGALNFGIAAGTTTASSQTLSIGNGGAGSLQWTAAASTGSGGNWLTLSSTSGQAFVDTPATIQVSANASGLKAGVYAGSVTVKSSTTSETVVVQVTLSVLAQNPTLLVSQTGLLFTGVDKGPAIAPQTFGVLNSGTGTMNWTATASVLGGGNWLTVTPASGSSVGNSTQVPMVTVNVDVTGLRSGQYSGQVVINAPGAPNSPQIVAVFFSVLPEGSNPGVTVRPTGLIFIAPAGGRDPGSQNVQMSSAAASTATYASGVLTLNGVNWAKALPVSGTVAPGIGRTLVVQPTLGSLAPGSYHGSLNLLFGDGSPTQNVDLLFLVLPAGSRVNAQGVREPSAACVPKTLLALSRALSNNFNSPAGWPTSLEVQVADDCGNLVPSATVVASFSNGDAPLALVGLGNGTYTGTWRPSAISSQTVVTLQAFQPPLSPAKVFIQGGVGTNINVPAVGSGGVVNGASFDKNEVLAPGSIASVFGSSMTVSSTANVGLTIPLPTTLDGASLTIGGLPAPLFYTSTGQINAQIPFELPPNSRPQVVLRTPTAIAVPETITMDIARPGIFLTGPASQGVVVTPTNQLVDAAHPVSAGDVVVVYCTGLGTTNPVVATNQASPSSPPATSVIQPTATIGGVNAPVQFAGLTPGFIGLYQVNVQIPPGVAPGAVPLVLTQGGVSSNTVTIGVK